MPILPAEQDLFPEGLFDVGPIADNPDRVWWVLHTKPRQEKSLARQLVDGQVPFYLPQIARRTVVRGRVVPAHIPLFAGYVFLLAEEKERFQALATGRVAHTLRVGDQTRLWQDLRQVHHLIKSDMPVTPEDRLAPGMEVEIRHGRLAGLRGRILRTASGNRFVIQVNFIQQGASIEIDDFMLGKVGR